MYARLTALVAASAFLLVAGARNVARNEFADVTLGRRTFTGQTVAFACYGGGGDCECPLDNNGDPGVLINVYPGYQCAYGGGACTWDDKVSFIAFAVRTTHL